VRLGRAADRIGALIEEALAVGRLPTALANATPSLATAGFGIPLGPARPNPVLT